MVRQLVDLAPQIHVAARHAQDFAASHAGMQGHQHGPRSLLHRGHRSHARGNHCRSQHQSDFRPLPRAPPGVGLPGELDFWPRAFARPFPLLDSQRPDGPELLCFAQHAGTRDLFQPGITPARQIVARDLMKDFGRQLGKFAQPSVETQVVGPRRR